MPVIKYPWWKDIKRELKMYPKYKRLPDLNPDALESIERGLERIKQEDGWLSTVTILNAVYFRKSHNVAGAAYLAMCSERTAHYKIVSAFKIFAEEFGMIAEK